MNTIDPKQESGVSGGYRPEDEAGQGESLALLPRQRQCPEGHGGESGNNSPNRREPRKEGDDADHQCDDSEHPGSGRRGRHRSGRRHRWNV